MNIYFRLLLFGHFQEQLSDYGHVDLKGQRKERFFSAGRNDLGFQGKGQSYNEIMQRVVNYMVIGQVNVLDVFHGFESCLLESPWWDRENWGWKIGGAVVFETPLPYRGQLRLFDVELVDALRALRKCINGPLMPCAQKPHER